MANIQKRGNSYRIRVFVGTDKKGKQIMKSATFTPEKGTSEKKAEKLALEFAIDFENKCRGLVQFNDMMTFSELADWYFETYAVAELKESTKYTYYGQYTKYIEPMLGRYRLKDINPPLLSSLLSGITDLQPKSVKKVYVVIQSIFKRAVEQGFIRDCPCHNVILPKDKNKKKVHSLSVEEVKRLIKMLDEKPWDEDFKRIIKFLLFTGMRCGEALGLAWDDIDFENKMISISHTLNDIGGRHERTAPKTESSTRVIAMNKTVENLLHEQKKYIEEMKVNLGDSFRHPEMVFVSARGNYRDRSSLLTSLKRFTAGTEFEALTLHKLRHCYASLLLDSGVDLKIISDTLGHCNISVTADIYADVLKKSKILVADKLENLLYDEAEVTEAV